MRFLRKENIQTQARLENLQTRKPMKFFAFPTAQLNSKVKHGTNNPPNRISTEMNS